jgi:hypothetical protein
MLIPFFSYRLDIAAVDLVSFVFVLEARYTNRLDASGIGDLQALGLRRSARCTPAPEVAITDRFPCLGARSAA